MSGSPPADSEGHARLILVVEDEVIVALDLVATLEEAGYRVLGPAPTVAAALTLLGQERPDAALLDMSLKGEMATPVARLLRQMGVPFVIASAFSRTTMPNDEAVRSAPCLRKPTAPALLLRSINDLLGGEAVPEAPGA